MQVQNRILYHISSELNWDVGQIIVAGMQENPFWKKCKDLSPVVSFNGQQMPLLDMVNLKPKYDNTENNIIFLAHNLEVVSREAALYIREQVFEAVRKDYFPDKPSRQKCLWVTEESELEYWLTMEESVERRLLVLELNGELFQADEHWLKLNTFSSIEFERRAHCYWKGEVSANPKFEYLFSGEASVKDVQILPANK